MFGPALDVSEVCTYTNRQLDNYLDGHNHKTRIICRTVNNKCISITVFIFSLVSIKPSLNNIEIN